MRQLVGGPEVDARQVRMGAKKLHVVHAAEGRSSQQLLEDAKKAIKDKPELDMSPFTKNLDVNRLRLPINKHGEISHVAGWAVLQTLHTGCDDCALGTASGEKAKLTRKGTELPLTGMTVVPTPEGNIYDIYYI